MTEKENTDNLRRCKSYPSCNKNHCPLDFDLEERVDGGFCKWLVEENKVKAWGQDVVFGGKQMPDDLLKYVPVGNVKMLNKISRERYKKLSSKTPG